MRPTKRLSHDLTEGMDPLLSRSLLGCEPVLRLLRLLLRLLRLLLRLLRLLRRPLVGWP